MNLTITPFTLDDYPAAYALWQATPGIGLSGADEYPALARFLEHNPGLSFLARLDGELAGTILASTDWRRGYLHHLAVHTLHRRQGIGRALVNTSLAALAGLGIQRCHIFVYGANQDGRLFWEQQGFFRRGDIEIMSKNL